MPGGDRTGPMGFGPRTGRGLGYCSGFNTPGFYRSWPGRGGGRGWWRLGWMGPAAAGLGYLANRTFAGFWPQADPQQQKSMLRQQAEAMEKQLAEIQAELKRLESQENQ